MGVELITPIKAKHILENHTNYRSVRPLRVRQYARLMKCGKWRIAQALMFDKEGFLRDGQHRLNAVIESGVAVEFNVIRNAEADDVGCYDTGLPRGGGDALLATGMVSDRQNQRASLMRLLHGRDRGTGGRGSSMTCIVSEYPHLYPIYKRGIDFVLECFPTSRRGFSRAGIIISWGSAFLARPEDEHRLKSAAQKYFNMQFEGDTDNPLRLLARYASNSDLGCKGGSAQAIDYLKSSSALRCWLDGIPMKVLIAASKDPFPLPRRYIERLRQNGFLFDSESGSSAKAVAK